MKQEVLMILDTLIVVSILVAVSVAVVLFIYVVIQSMLVLDFTDRRVCGSNDYSVEPCVTNAWCERHGSKRVYGRCQLDKNNTAFLSSLIYSR